MEAEIEEQLEAFSADVRRGLGRQPKSLPAKYFYDETGSQLFEEITRQPEYYPTRTEATILRRHAADIHELLDCDVSLVELGSGSSVKTTILLDALIEKQQALHYLPIDISPTILEETAVRLDARYPELDVTTIASEYGLGLHQAHRILESRRESPRRKLVLFLGSSIGNLEPAAAVAFLHKVTHVLEKGDGLLVGFDLQKDPAILNAAYNDAQGVTARFNRNVLMRINRELGGEFDLDRFSHSAFYNEELARIEMHLVSESRQDVRVAALEEVFHFEAEETIHTESSYKYTREKIAEFAEAAGFRIAELFTDERDWFALSLFTPA